MKASITKGMILILLLAGITLFAIYLLSTYVPKGGWTPSPQQNETQIPDMPSFELPISEIIAIKSESTYYMKVYLEDNVTLAGNLKESAGMCIGFMIMNETNMKNWLNNEYVSAYAKAETIGEYNFTFTTDHEGTYYLVFDNREMFVHAPCNDKVVIFNLKRQE